MAYTPSSNNTSTATLQHFVSVYYDRKGLDILQKKFQFRQVCMPDVLPKRNGKTVQWYRYDNLAASSTTTTEGTVGTGISMTTRVVAATVSQYSSFITLSDFVVHTAIDPIVTSASERLGYRAGLSVDTITRNVIDAAAASITLSLLGASFKVADLRNLRSVLAAIDVEPFDNGEYLVIMHPYISFDLVNDPAASGLADIFKYTSPMSTPLVKYEDRGTVTHVAGCRVIESTNVYTLSTNYRTYGFGKGGIGCVTLEGEGPSNVTDPKKQNFKINVIPGKPQIADPEGVIGAAVSYNFFYTAVYLEGPAGIAGSYRNRVWDTASTLG